MNRHKTIETIFELQLATMKAWKERMGTALKDINVSFQHIGALMTIREEQPVLGKEIAQRLRLTPSSVTQAVDHLVKAGYVTREQDEKDRRAVRLRLTTEGEQLIQRIHEKRRQFLYVSTATLTDKELEAELRIQQKMLAAVQEAPEQQNSNEERA